MLAMHSAAFGHMTREEDSIDKMIFQYLTYTPGPGAILPEVHVPTISVMCVVHGLIPRLPIFHL